MADLIPAPILEIRDEEQLAAEAIGRTSGRLTVGIVNSQIEERRRILQLIQSGALGAPVCAELTNANPSSPHTVILEAQAWLLSQMAHRINKLPRRDQIEFARLFKIELRQAEPAATVLEFSVAPPNGVDVTVPPGAQVATEDKKVIFETTAQLVIPFGDPSGQVAAKNTAAGATLLAPGKLTRMVDAIAWVDSVTNPEAIDGGNNDEEVEEALERARSYQRRGERLVSTLDLEEAILHDVLRGNGIVRGFPFVVLGDFSGPSKPGHTTVVAMTRNGNPISAADKQAINSILEQRVGNQFIYISDPIYVQFSVSVKVRLFSNASTNAAKAAIESSLRAFYAPGRENFGRPILRSEIIALVEGARGVDRIVSESGGAILASPLVDVKLNPWELPKLVTVTVDAI
jgi:uncharacterized phage protein gp47/JayE